MGTLIVADPSHKGSDVFGLTVCFQEAADFVVAAHEMKVQ
jgi:hypothetical protein